MKKAIFYCLPVGAAGGAFLSLAGLVAPVTGLFLGCIYGLIFCLVARPRANTPGAGLLWGLAFALVFWLAGPAAIGPLFVSASSGSTMMLEQCALVSLTWLVTYYFLVLHWASFLAP